MEKEKINVAELLKNCPTGMKLDCVMFEDVVFDKIANNKIFTIYIKRDDGFPIALTKYGEYSNCPSAKCVIFPKGKTTWEGFVPPRKFKVGDRVKTKTSRYEYTITEIRKDCYIMFYATDKFGYHVPFCNEDNFELVSNKFDITTLIPFESRALVRDYDTQVWAPTFWGKRFKDDSNCNYLTTNGHYKYCIPYEGNQHLLGNTDDCDDFYKTWE